MTFWQFEEWYWETLPKFIGKQIRNIVIVLAYISMIPFAIIGVILATWSAGFFLAYRTTYTWWKSRIK